MSDKHHHDHRHSHHHHHSHFSSDKKLLIVFLLNLFMSIIEFIGGLYTNSTAILADALHDFGDAIALGSSWILEKVSKKTGDQHFSFGYKRFSLLAALINSLILLVGSFLILKEVFPRILSPEEVNTSAMIGFALFGLLVNGGSVLLLKGGSSYNERVVTLHLLEDVLGWVAVLIGAIVMNYYPLPILDPILSLLIALFILKNVYVNLKDVLFIFLQGTPQNIDLKVLQEKLLNHEFIQKIYHIHVWSLDGEKHVLTAHVVLKKSVQLSDIPQIQKWVQEKTQAAGLWHSTIQYEISV